MQQKIIQLHDRAFQFLPPTRIHAEMVVEHCETYFGPQGITSLDDFTLVAAELINDVFLLTGEDAVTKEWAENLTVPEIRGLMDEVVRWCYEVDRLFKVKAVIH